jgi:hypothetical protein
MNKFLHRIQTQDPEVDEVKFVEVISCVGGRGVGGGTPQPSDLTLANKVRIYL